MLHKNKILLWIFLFVVNMGAAQKIIDAGAYTNFNEFCTNFESQWKDKKPQKGDGYKQFKRWEWYMKDRVKLDGSLYNTAHVWREFQNLNVHKKRVASSSRADNDWKSLGPANPVDSFPDFGVGRINCIAFHPTDEKILFVGAAGGGIYKSIDEGATWSSLNANLPSLSVSDIAVHPINPDILYIATGDADGGGNYFGGFSFGVMKSIDGGKSWGKTGLSFDYMNTKHIYRLIINPANPAVLFAASTDGLYKTSNDGGDWNKIIDGKFCDVEFSPANDSVIYAVTMLTSKSVAKFYKSINSGESADIIYEDSTTWRTNIAVSKKRPEDVWVLACDLYRNFNYIVYSENGGPFELLSKDINVNILDVSIDGSGIDGQGSYDLAFAINPINANEFLVGGINTWQSKNDGQSIDLVNYWTPFMNPSTPVVHADKHNLYYHPMNNKIYEANDGGIYVSEDNGVSWRDLTKGMDIGQVYRMDYFADNLLAGHQDNGTKLLNKGAWDIVGGGDGMDNAINRKNKNIQFIGVQYGVIYRTLDFYQADYKKVSDYMLDTLKQKGKFVTPYVLHPESGNVYAGYQDVFKSTNNGNTWVNLSKKGFPISLDQIAVSPIDEQIIYASALNFLIVTLDGGVNWVDINLNLQSKITSIRCSPNDKNTAAITVGGFQNGNKVFISEDGGKNWVNISFDLPNLPTNSLEFQKGENGALYVGNDFGVFKLNKVDSKWELFSNNLPLVPITDMVIDDSENKLYISTFGRGMWVSEIEPASTVSATIDPKTLMAKNGETVTLSPNPFHDDLLLKLNKALSYDVNIYDYKGQLVHKTKLSNKEEHVLNLANLTNGFYIIQFTNKEFTVSKQIIKN